MVDMLHAHGNHLFYDRKQVQRMKPYPPLQILLAAAMLRQNGVSVALCDVNLEAPDPNRIHTARLDLLETREEVEA